MNLFQYFKCGTFCLNLYFLCIMSLGVNGCPTDCPRTVISYVYKRRLQKATQNDPSVEGRFLERHRRKRVYWVSLCRIVVLANFQLGDRFPVDPELNNLPSPD